MDMSFLDEDMEMIEVLDHPALFSNGRIPRKAVPEGLYAYDLYESCDTGDFCYIAPRVIVNHGGTVLTKEPIDFSGADRIDLTEDTSPNFLGGTMRVHDFMAASGRAAAVQRRTAARRNVMPELTMGSLFDGIGGFPLAAVRNGITPVWASEIEPFPIEVTKTHFPDMMHVGDITKLKGCGAAARGHHLRGQPVSGLCRRNSYSEVAASSPINPGLSTKTSE